MFIIDCISPISQRILEKKLNKYIKNSEKEQFIITDRVDLNGLNIIKIDKDIFFPFRESQIEKYLTENRENKPKVELVQFPNIDKKIRDEIVQIIKNSHNKILEEVELLLEKR